MSENNAPIVQNIPYFNSKNKKDIKIGNMSHRRLYEYIAPVL